MNLKFHLIKAGGDISEALDSLYEYMIRRLVEANMKKDSKNSKRRFRSNA